MYLVVPFGIVRAGVIIEVRLANVMVGVGAVGAVNLIRWGAWEVWGARVRRATV